MQIVRGLHNLRQTHHGSVLTIGNFDGVHRGHQAILKRLKECAMEHGLPATVMIFEPHPEELFQGQSAPARINRLREKLAVLKSFAIDRVIVAKFDKNFAAMSAEDFIQDLLHDSFGVKHLIVGDDFHFGHKRQGNYALLEQWSKRLDFSLERTSTLFHEQTRISSTAVREALSVPNLKLAKTLLGRSYEISGKVVHGAKKGRTIGFPTANVFLHRVNSPIAGVFAVHVTLPNKPNLGIIKGVTNIGNRPTVDGTRVLLEVHLFDWQEDIYAEPIRVKFVNHIRAEKKFDSFDLLKRQIEQDVLIAKEFFE